MGICEACGQKTPEPRFITVEYEVVGRYMVQGTSLDQCRETLEDDMSEVFVSYEIREVK